MSFDASVSTPGNSKQTPAETRRRVKEMKLKQPDARTKAFQPGDLQRERWQTGSSAEIVGTVLHTKQQHKSIMRAPTNHGQFQPGGYQWARWQTAEEHEIEAQTWTKEKAGTRWARPLQESAKFAEQLEGEERAANAGNILHIENRMARPTTVSALFDSMVADQTQRDAWRTRLLDSGRNIMESNSDDDSDNEAGDAIDDRANGKRRTALEARARLVTDIQPETRRGFPALRRVVRTLAHWQQLWYEYRHAMAQQQAEQAAQQALKNKLAGIVDADADINADVDAYGDTDTHAGLGVIASPVSQALRGLTNGQRALVFGQYAAASACAPAEAAGWGWRWNSVPVASPTRAARPFGTRLDFSHSMRDPARASFSVPTRRLRLVSALQRLLSELLAEAEGARIAAEHKKKAQRLRRSAGGLQGWLRSGTKAICGGTATLMRTTSHSMAKLSVEMRSGVHRRRGRDNQPTRFATRLITCCKGRRVIPVCAEGTIGEHFDSTTGSNAPYAAEAAAAAAARVDAPRRDLYPTAARDRARREAEAAQRVAAATRAVVEAQRYRVSRRSRPPLEPLARTPALATMHLLVGIDLSGQDLRRAVPPPDRNISKGLCGIVCARMRAWRAGVLQRRTLDPILLLASFVRRRPELRSLILRRCRVSSKQLVVLAAAIEEQPRYFARGNDLRRALGRLPPLSLSAQPKPAAAQAAAAHAAVATAEAKPSWRNRRAAKKAVKRASLSAAIQSAREFQWGACDVAGWSWRQKCGTVDHGTPPAAGTDAAGFSGWQEIELWQARRAGLGAHQVLQKGGLTELDLSHNRVCGMWYEGLFGDREQHIGGNFDGIGGQAGTAAAVAAATDEDNENEFGARHGQRIVIIPRRRAERLNESFDRLMRGKGTGERQEQRPEAIRLQAGGGPVRPKRAVGVRRHGRWQPAGVDALGAALELNSNLRALRIEGNWLGGRGISSLAAALVRRGTLSHGSLTQLDLGANALLGDAIAAVTKLPSSKRGDKVQEQDQFSQHEQLQDHSQKLDKGEKQVRVKGKAQDEEKAGNEEILQREFLGQAHDQGNAEERDLHENFAHAHEASTMDGDRHVATPTIPENKQKMLQKRKQKQQLGRTITVPGGWCDDVGNVFNRANKDVLKECWCDGAGNVITQQRNNVLERNRPSAVSEGAVGMMSGFTGRGTVDIMAERKVVTGVADMEISSTLYVGRVGPEQCAAMEMEKKKEAEALNLRPRRLFRIAPTGVEDGVTPAGEVAAGAGLWLAFALLRGMPPESATSGAGPTPTNSVSPQVKRGISEHNGCSTLLRLDLSCNPLYSRGCELLASALCCSSQPQVSSPPVSSLTALDLAYCALAQDRSGNPCLTGVTALLDALSGATPLSTIAELSLAGNDLTGGPTSEYALCDAVDALARLVSGVDVIGGRVSAAVKARRRSVAVVAAQVAAAADDEEGDDNILAEDEDENEDEIEGEGEDEGGHCGTGRSSDNQEITINVAETPETDESVEADTRSSELVVPEEAPEREPESRGRRFRHCALTRLDITRVGLTTGSVESLTRAFSTNESIHTLKIGENLLCNRGMTALTTALRPTPSSTSNMSDAPWATTAQMLSNGQPSSEHQRFALTASDVTEPSSGSIVAAIDLSFSPLDMSAQHSSAECMSALGNLISPGMAFDATTGGTTITHTLGTVCRIDLSCCKLGCAGLELLAPALKHRSCALEALSLANNALNEKGAENLLADIIIVNTTLVELDLSQNHFCGAFDINHRWVRTPEKLMRVLAQALRYNGTWERCDLRESATIEAERRSLIREFGSRLII